MGIALPELSVEADYAVEGSKLETTKSPLPTDRAAAVLLSGLFSPLTLKWKVELDNGFSASVTKDL